MSVRTARSSRIENRRLSRRPIYAMAAIPLLALGLAGCSLAGDDAGPAETTSPAPSSSSSSSATAEPDAAQPSGACADDLAVSVNTVDASGYYLEFINETDTECVLQGFPTVALVDASGNQLGDVARESDGFERSNTSVSVLPGEAAYAEYITSPASQIGNGVCDPIVLLSGFNVTAPGASSATFVAMESLSSCTGEEWMTSSSVGPIDSEMRISGS